MFNCFKLSLNCKKTRLHLKGGGQVVTAKHFLKLRPRLHYTGLLFIPD